METLSNQIEHTYRKLTVAGYLLGASYPCLAALRLGASLTIGRRTESGVNLRHKQVSRHHATLSVVDGGAITIRDAGSKCGTWVDQVRVAGDPLVVSQDVVLSIAGEPMVIIGPALPPSAFPPELLRRLTKRTAEYSMPAEDPYMQEGFWPAVQDPDETILAEPDELVRDVVLEQGCLRLGLLPLLLFAFAQSRSTGELRLEGVDSVVKLTLRKGAVTCAVCGDQRGMEAVQAGAILSSGYYVFRQTSSSHETCPCVSVSARDLILECCSRCT